MAKINRFNGTIQGKEYVITTSENQTHMEAVFEMLNQQLNELKAQSPDLSEIDAMALLAINAFSDQLKMQVERDK
ncbi:MAG: cell division protein ZapA [Lactobacillaceae bacterium]|jgi:cell division protein ZapA|nr:cell division protein ZapA [Lactobacillaceae bacterium]